MLRNNKSFTLVEMLLVVMIIGFLVSIIVIRAGDIAKDSKINAVMADLRTIKSAVETYYVTYSEFPLTGSDNLETYLTTANPRLIDYVPVDPYATGTTKYGYLFTDPYYAVWSVGSDGNGSVGSIGTSDGGTVTETGSTIWVSNCRVHNNGKDGKACDE